MLCLVTRHRLWYPNRITHKVHHCRDPGSANNADRQREETIEIRAFSLRRVHDACRKSAISIYIIQFFHWLQPTECCFLFITSNFNRITLSCVFFPVKTKLQCKCTIFDAHALYNELRPSNKKKSFFVKILASYDATSLKNFNQHEFQSIAACELNSSIMCTVCISVEFFSFHVRSVYAVDIFFSSHSFVLLAALLFSVFTLCVCVCLLVCKCACDV